ncbi:protein kinase domain-containing protein [Archangium sp.]|uniref:protein kinase domain-containing protein n=1 Tax=Archangium sp. TaxID=1872627 RepID=UPI00389AA0A7
MLPRLIPPSNATRIVAPTEAREFGKYELVAKIAAGGMAVTYRALMKGAAGVTKPVVIKQILPHFADDPDFVEMFVGEARLVAGLNHSNIAQVFDFGEIDGSYFLAMEFVHGQPLSKLLRRALKSGMPGVPLPLALFIATQMCDGLDHAHRHLGADGKPMGLVHRDVSPDNVLLSYEGQVKVIDFGIAKATSAVESRTSPGTLKGKYPYFSTEQAMGRQDLDARSDTFAVGVVLYEMLCGRRPYEGELVTVLPRILAGDYAPPSSLNPAISPELESVMYTAMALDREERYPTAQAFSEALREQLYSAFPRFSPAMLSQFLGHLFTEELTAEGRRVEVTPAFLEQLAAWQSPEGIPTGVQSRPPPGTGPGNTRPSTGSGMRAVQSRPGSDGGRKLPSASGRPASNSGMRSSTGSVRRVTSSTGIVRSQASATAAAPPTSGAEPSTSVSGPSTATRSAAEGPHDTPVELPAVNPPRGGVVDHLRPIREARAREEAERSERRQRLVMLLSVPLFVLAVAFGAIHYFRSGKSEGVPSTSLWVASKPAGASVKLNGKELPDKTPLVIPNVPLDQANTLVLTLDGYKPWIKRFTLTVENELFPSAELERMEPAPGTPPTAAAQPEAAADAGTATDAGTAVAGSTDSAPEKDPSFNVVDYPTRLFVLRARYNAFPVAKYGPASIELNPGASYAINTSGSASLGGEGRGGSNTLAYFAEGENLSAEDSFGLLGPASRTIKGARRLYVFMLDDDRADNSGTVRVTLRQSKWVAPRQLTFDATTDALVLAPEHQLLLRGLHPEATYLLTVRDDFPELRPGANGRTRRVLCAESSQKSGRRNHRLLEAGKRYQLTGADTLRCAFPDVKVEDNAGALEVDLVDVTEMSRRDRAAALRGASR